MEKPLKPTIVSFVNFSATKASSEDDDQDGGSRKQPEPTIGNFSLFAKKPLSSESVLGGTAAL